MGGTSEPYAQPAATGAARSPRAFVWFDQESNREPVVLSGVMEPDMLSGSTQRARPSDGLWCTSGFEVALAVEARVRRVGDEGREEKADDAQGASWTSN